MGTERGVLNQFIDFWRDGYDWAQRRDRLNQLPHVWTTVDGHGIHFLHFRSGQSGSIPLLLMNGWPSSFVEFQRIAPLLTQGTPAFDVVIPTMPGFGYSDRPTRPYEAEPSDLYPKLMTMLGYGRFVVAGTDIGSGLATRIALRHAARLLALHVSAVALKPIPEDASPLSKAEIDYDERLQLWSREEGAIRRSRARGHKLSPLGLPTVLLASPRGLSRNFGPGRTAMATSSLSGHSKP
ncbi:epoxide hydrolase [Mesorhizobium sp. M6A.T.Ca.TU.002.02.2.1]|nr:epoxide hydrolase [Mesorhizobium sp. M6A.T.Ca.TU.002.02.2.1]